MAEKPAEQPEKLEQLEVQTEYPESLPTLYANYANLNVTSEEVFLDLCVVEPQTLKITGPRQGTVKASAKVRVLMTHQNAVRIAAAMLVQIQHMNPGAAEAIAAAVTNASTGKKAGR